MEKKWVQSAMPSPERLRALADAFAPLPIPNKEIYLRLFAQRAIFDLPSAIGFLNPELDQLHNPFLMKDMDVAVARLESAIRKGEKILVFGDYDVDGTTAVSLVYSFFRKHYENVSYYIPRRLEEGFGVSFSSLDRMAEEGVRLVIALDYGIKAHEQVAYARAKGIDFIICDHHQPSATLPGAVAILNPKRRDCTYPFSELSGCGIGYKLAAAYAQKNSLPFAPQDYLDFAAVSIASDFVPVIGENRIMAYYGLQRLNAIARPGFAALKSLARVRGSLTLTDLVFKMGPRLNAAGRLGDGALAVEMLLAENPYRARRIAKQVDTLNSSRQSLDIHITQEAMQLVEENESQKDSHTIVLYNPDWHQGVIGIVASRLMEKYHRPSVMLTSSAAGQLVGSARSVPGYNLYAALEKCSHLFESWGGHQAAAGLALKEENLSAFRDLLEQAVKNSFEEELRTPVFAYDLELPIENVKAEFVHTLQRFGPFGPQNAKPVFMSRGVTLGKDLHISGNNHLHLSVAQDGHYLKGVAFGQGNYLEALKNADAVDILYSLEPVHRDDEDGFVLYVRDIKVEM